MRRGSAYLLNYGYQMVSIIDALVDRHDVIVYDSESHACIMDGLGFTSEDDLSFRTMIWKAVETAASMHAKLVRETGGGILVIT
ncbi:MAG: hypothetical protein U5L72_18020 [Bacteroidales bacterium]|nr:hypothetical protein [Bacteroidales bacterium]